VLIEKLEDFVTGLLLPLFFAISGLRTNISRVHDPVTVGLLVLVFTMASFAKVMGTILIAVSYTMTFRDGVALGFLMNTRGLVEMIVLNIGRDKEVSSRLRLLRQRTHEHQRTCCCKALTNNK
jgi:Kef-type K+ transport system membrane component KefB